MSKHLVRLLVCDKPSCTAAFVHGSQPKQQFVPLSTLRRAARQQGWRRTRGNRDYCPKHTPWPGVAAWAQAPAAEPTAPSTTRKDGRS